MRRAVTLPDWADTFADALIGPLTLLKDHSLLKKLLRLQVSVINRIY